MRFTSSRLFCRSLSSNSPNASLYTSFTLLPHPRDISNHQAADVSEPVVAPHATASTPLSTVSADSKTNGSTSLITPEAVASSLVPARLPTTDRFSSQEWFTSMATNSEWVRRPEMPGLYSFGPNEFVFAPSRY